MSDSAGPSVDASPTRTKVPPPRPRKTGSRRSRSETAGQLLLDSLGLAPFDTGRGFEMTLRMEREGKKCYGGHKDDGRNPETAHTHCTHHVIQIVAPRTLEWHSMGAQMCTIGSAKLR